MAQQHDHDQKRELPPEIESVIHPVQTRSPGGEESNTVGLRSGFTSVTGSDGRKGRAREDDRDEESGSRLGRRCDDQSAPSETSGTRPLLPVRRNRDRGSHLPVRLFPLYTTPTTFSQAGRVTERIAVRSSLRYSETPLRRFAIATNRVTTVWPSSTARAVPDMFTLDRGHQCSRCLRALQLSTPQAATHRPHAPLLDGVDARNPRR